jgi:hypothetical protein
MNYHKCSSLKQHKFPVLQFGMSEVQNRSHWTKVKVLASLVPSEGFREESISLFSAASKHCPYYLALGSVSL